VSAAIAESPVAAVNSTRALLRLLALDAGAVTTALLSAGARPASQRSSTPGDVVDVLMSEEEVTVAPDHPAALVVKLVIAPGYHVNSAFAAEQSGGVVIPLRIGLTGGTG